MTKLKSMSLFLLCCIYSWVYWENKHKYWLHFILMCPCYSVIVHLSTEYRVALKVTAGYIPAADFVVNFNQTTKEKKIITHCSSQVF